MLAFQAESRGNESWGVMKLGVDDIPLVIKNVGSIVTHCPLQDLDVSMLIGHTRQATVGAISQMNAHPFEIGNTIGVHNGFILNHQALNVKYNRGYEVDSQHIIAHLEEDKDLEELEGDGTVVFVNHDTPKEIYFGRGAMSNLEIFGLGTVENSKGLVWGTSGEWVKTALHFAGFENYFQYDTKPKMLYVTDKYGLGEVEEFKLSLRGRNKYTTLRSTYEHGYSQVEWQSQDSIESFDERIEYWRNHYKVGNSVTPITSEPVNPYHFGDFSGCSNSLKKKMVRFMELLPKKREKLRRQLEAVWGVSIGVHELPNIHQMWLDWSIAHKLEDSSANPATSSGLRLLTQKIDDLP